MRAAASRFIEKPQLGVGRLCSRVLFTMYFQGCLVTGRQNIPTDRPYILALNHASIVDPPLVWAFFPDPVYFLTKQELHDLPVFGWMCDRVGNIPVRRGAFDLRAIRTALKYLTEYKRNLAIFVEGTRSEDGQLTEAKLGAALLAMKTGTPVLPAYIDGSRDVLPVGRIVPRYVKRLSLSIGTPLDFGKPKERPERPELEQATRAIVDAIESCHPERRAALAQKGAP
jgi:1-acyl-sn-glycerol-3-phosphate acyltransferase